MLVITSRISIPLSEFAFELPSGGRRLMSRPYRTNSSLLQLVAVMMMKDLAKPTAKPTLGIPDRSAQARRAGAFPAVGTTVPRPLW